MAVRASTELVTKLAQGYGLRDLMRDMRVFIYAGAQPDSADSAPVTNILVPVTLEGATYTGPTQCIAQVALVGTGGSLNNIRVGGASATTGIDILGGAITNPGTAAGLVTLAVAQINATSNALGIYASDGGSDTIYLHAPAQVGADYNTLGVFAASTTTTVNVNASGAGATSSSTMAGDTPAQVGVSAVNGLTFDFPSADGVLSIPSGENWKGTAINAGTAGFARCVAAGSTPDGVSGSDIRFDCSVASSGGDLTMGSTTVAVGAVESVTDFTITMPTSE